MASIACHRSCRKCDGPEKQNCLKCLPQMFFANSSLWGRLCVTNCESVGMYNEDSLKKCVGCHPTCEPDKCFGPSNTQCYDCASGFVRYDKYTCDTECMPENSFIRGEEECVCMSYAIFSIFQNAMKAAGNVMVLIKTSARHATSHTTYLSQHASTMRPWQKSTMRDTGRQVAKKFSSFLAHAR